MKLNLALASPFVLLATVAAAQRTGLDAVGYARGPEGARTTIVEFCDFECPYCAGLSGTLRSLEAQYPNDVRLVYRNFPRASHKDAPKAAEAAACAGDQGRFWEMHDRLYADQDQLNEPAYRRDAEDLGLDVPRFVQCLNSGRHEGDVRRDLAAGRAAGATATPTLFVNGVPLEGDPGLAELSRLVEQAR